MRMMTVYMEQCLILCLEKTHQRLMVCVVFVATRIIAASSWNLGILDGYWGTSYFSVECRVWIRVLNCQIIWTIFQLRRSDLGTYCKFSVYRNSSVYACFFGCAPPSSTVLDQRYSVFCRCLLVGACSENKHQHHQAQNRDISSHSVPSRTKNVSHSLTSKGFRLYLGIRVVEKLVVYSESCERFSALAWCLLEASVMAHGDGDRENPSSQSLLLTVYCSHPSGLVTTTLVAISYNRLITIHSSKKSREQTTK